MEKPQVIFVHFSLHPGGIEVLLPEIISSMPQYSFSSFVIRPPERGRPTVFSKIPVSIYFGSGNTLLAVMKLFLHARRNRKEIFHVFNIGPLFLLTLRMAGVRKLVYSIHGTRYWDNWRQRVWRKALWRMAMHRRYLLTSNSAFSGMVFRQEVLPVNEITVLYNPIDNKRFAPWPDVNKLPQFRRIIYCGRLDRGKNLDSWIRVAIGLKKSFPAVTFRIYGEGSESTHLDSLIKEEGADEYITLEGYIPSPETAYRDADLMIFLSSYESFGNVVVESVLCGTPVIAGDIPSMREIFADFPELIVEMDETMEKNIRQKMNDPGLLIELTMKARESFITRFDPAVHYRMLDSIYSGLLKK